MGSTSLSARARALWAERRRRDALDLLKGSMRSGDALASDRRVLAEFYRELGAPDQAGRWGIVFDGWTTDRERDRLARLLASSGVYTADLATFLSLPRRTPHPPELTALMAGPVEAYRERARQEIRAAQRRPHRQIEDLQSSCWFVTVVTVVLAPLVVFAMAAIGVDATFAARFSGVIIVALVGISLLATSLVAVVAGNRRTAVWTGAIGLILVAGVVVTLVATGGTL